MSPFVTFLMFLVVSLLIGVSCGDRSLGRRTNVANRSDNNTCNNIYTKINTLEKDLSNLETKLRKRTKLLQQVLRSVLEMDSNLEMSETNLASKRNAIGFTVKLPTTTFNSRTSILQGGKILYNGGNAYNGTVFTCPSPGLYLFHVSVVTKTRYGGIWIYKNTQQLTLACAGHGDPQYNGASVSAAVWLDVGDQIYLRPNNLPMVIDHNSVFTGVKVN
ncbi:uncharacterized protein LOC111110735 [Crassostrea virginica]